MGTDDLFKKRREALKERKKEIREPKPNSFLIVTEGQKTEPNYFKGLSDYIKEKYGFGPDVKSPIIDIRGEGKCTCSLVHSAVQIAKKSHIMYEHQWVVFDKDDFTDFDEAIQLAQDSGFEAGWSNQSFEFWLLLHFYYCDSALHRTEWNEKLDEQFKKMGISKDGYEKNNPDIFEIATTKGSLKSAISYSMNINEKYHDSTPPSERDPSNTVYKLILELKPFLEGLF